jgi:hypothetical protein
LKIQLYNRNTKSIIIYDAHEARFKRKRRRVNVWAKEYKELINMGHDRSKPYDAIFITLTYRDNESHKKGDVRTYLHRLKKRLGDKLIAYAWVLEMQKRGVPHYHIMLIVKKGTRVSKPDKGDWSGGHSNIQKAYKGIYYIISYLKKSIDLEIEYPKGYRIFAVYSSQKVVKYFIRRKSLPFWLMDLLQDLFMTTETAIKKIGNIWVIGGVSYKSPFIVLNNNNSLTPLAFLK